MKSLRATMSSDPPAVAATRLEALERIISYAKDEAEKLKADVLVFCLDASLSVARGELESRKCRSDLEPIGEIHRGPISHH